MAVSAGSVQGLLGVVRGWDHGPAQDPRLVPLALEALVGAVHVLHASRTPPRGPELRTLLEGYFRILNADWPAGPSPGPEEALVALRVSMLDAIPRMLACEDRPVLQATFLSNNCFEHLTRLIQNSKVGGAQLRGTRLGNPSWGLLGEPGLDWAGAVCGEQGGLRLGMALHPIGGGMWRKDRSCPGPFSPFLLPQGQGQEEGPLFLPTYLSCPQTQVCSEHGQLSDP